MVKTHHPVAELPFRHAAASGYNGAGHFVAKNLRRRNVGMINLLDVGAANAASGNFNEHFALGHFGDGDFFHTHDSLFAVDAGAHGLGYGTKRLQGSECCSGPAHRAATSSMDAAESVLNPWMNASRNSSSRSVTCFVREPKRIIAGII